MTRACSLTLSKGLNFGASFALLSNFQLNHLPKCSFAPIHMGSNCNLIVSNNDSRGALIVLEGLDRCGKTSQCSRLLSYLAGLGHSVELCRFPDRSGNVGQMISTYLSNQLHLSDHAVHLFFSANRWEKSSVMNNICSRNFKWGRVKARRCFCRSIIKTKLKAGTTLIVDHYSYSGVAFLSAKGIEIKWWKAPETGLPATDLVLYLDRPPEKAAERGGYGGERYEHLEFQKKVAQCFQILRDSSWKIIDACQTIEDVEKELQEMVLDHFITCQKGKPFSFLWPS